jgi:hypothetical protein
VTPPTPSLRELFRGQSQGFQSSPSCGHRHLARQWRHRPANATDPNRRAARRYASTPPSFVSPARLRRQHL